MAFHQVYLRDVRSIVPSILHRMFISSVQVNVSFFLEDCPCSSYPKVWWSLPNPTTADSVFFFPSIVQSRRNRDLEQLLLHPDATPSLMDAIWGFMATNPPGDLLALRFVHLSLRKESYLVFLDIPKTFNGLSPRVILKPVWFRFFSWTHLSMSAPLQSEYPVEHTSSGTWRVPSFRTDGSILHCFFVYSLIIS